MKRNGGEIHIYYEHGVDTAEVLEENVLLLEGPILQIEVGVEEPLKNIRAVNVNTVVRDASIKKKAKPNEW